MKQPIYLSIYMMFNSSPQAGPCFGSYFFWSRSSQMSRPGKQRFVSWGWTMLGHWAAFQFCFSFGLWRGQGPQLGGRWYIYIYNMYVYIYTVYMYIYIYSICIYIYMHMTYDIYKYNIYIYIG